MPSSPPPPPPPHHPPNLSLVANLLMAVLVCDACPVWVDQNVQDFREYTHSLCCSDLTTVVVPQMMNWGETPTRHSIAVNYSPMVHGDCSRGCSREGGWPPLTLFSAPPCSSHDLCRGLTINSSGGHAHKGVPETAARTSCCVLCAVQFALQTSARLADFTIGSPAGDRLAAAALADIHPPAVMLSLHLTDVEVCIIPFYLRPATSSKVCTTQTET